VRNLGRIFGLYTAGFVAVTVALGLAEAYLGLSKAWIGWIFMALSMGVYVIIGFVTRTSDADQYYVAGRGVPAFYNGMATAADWMSAASFISLGGALAAQGFGGLAYVMGWTGGYVLLAIFLGPYLRQYGRYTIPDFLGSRYQGNAARLIGVFAALLASFTYLVAQVTGVGLIVSRFIGLDFKVGVFVGLLGVLFCSVLGGMRSVTWTQVAQLIILVVSYLVPVVVLSFKLFTVPLPQLTYGQLLQSNSDRAVQITADPKERATRARWAEESRLLGQRIANPTLPEAERERMRADKAVADRQATAPAAEGARIERYLQVPQGTDLWNFLALTFCLMVGTAGLPHILTRFYTTPSVKQARTSVGWSLFFISLLYFTAPAYASFARDAVFRDLVGSRVTDLPRWVTLWGPAELFTVVDKLGDGVVQFADFVVKSTDFVVLATPEIAGLPFVITGLVMAGGLAAALSTADGLLLTIANSISHDLYYNVVNPRASLFRRLSITKVLLVTTAVVAAWVATFRLAIIVELVAWAFSLAAAAFFPALVMGIWWKRANRPGAIAGMIAGLGITLFYMIGSRFYGLSWLGTSTVASGVFGIPVGFLTIWIVSVVTDEPAKEVQALVESIRTPRSGGFSTAARRPPPLRVQAR
jgi:cation/acetate symporter